MWRLGCWILLWAAAHAQQAEEFAEEEDAVGLEERLAEEGVAQELALRWRVRGASAEPEDLQVYQRLEWRVGRQGEVYLLRERDPGEKRWDDFTALYAQWARPGLQVVAGDLRPGFGAGLVFGRQNRAGLLASAPAEDSPRLGYRSSGENQAFRGGALRVASRAWEGVVLAGLGRRDARLDSQGWVSSLPESGQHVSATEKEGRRLLGARLAGARLRRLGKNWSWGATGLEMRFDRRLDLRRGGRTPWGFVGERQRLWAVDARAKGDWLDGLVEMGRDSRGRWAGVGQVRARLGRVRARLLGRYFAPGFHSFLGASPGASGMQNELGGTAVLEGGRGRAYLDLYQRPERTYSLPVPGSLATTWGVEAEPRPAKHWRLQARWQERSRPFWQHGRLQEERSRKIRLDLDSAGWRVRLEGHQVESGGKIARGTLAGLVWRAGWRRARLVLHLSRFQADSYAARLYEYEYDLPGAVSIRPLYGKGWRGYTLLKIRWGGLEISGRYRLQKDRRVRHYGGTQVDLLLGKNS